jgi:hypothetical protein
MRELNIPPTVNTPSAEFDPTQLTLKIEGRCIPENPAGFFREITQWTEEVFPKLSGLITISIRLEYINSGSSKQVLSFLRLIESFKGEDGKDICLKWYYEDDDEAIQELGEDLKVSLKIPVELFVI